MPEDHEHMISRVYNLKNPPIEKAIGWLHNTVPVTPIYPKDNNANLNNVMKKMADIESKIDKLHDRLDEIYGEHIPIIKGNYLD